MTDSQVPNRIGKYEIMGVLGRGAMGVVYHGRDPEIGREVAVKTLRKIQAGQIQSADAALERFRMEARSAGSLRHPNIITIFEANRENDIPYLVMDYVIGDSLDVVLSRSGRLDPQTAIHYLNQIAAALDHAHSRGVIHRDIKPGNILVDRLGQVFILDFGVATITKGLAEPQSTSPGTAGPVLGSPAYMSPEQILNQRADPRSDVFSLAVVAFELLSGERPFPGANFTTVVGNILNGKARAFGSVAPHLPAALEEVFNRGLARDPGARFESASKLVAAIGGALNIHTSPAGGAANEAAPAVRRRKTTGWKSFKRTEVVERIRQEAGRVRTYTSERLSAWRMDQRRPDVDERPPSPVQNPGSIFAPRGGDPGASVRRSRGKAERKEVPVVLIAAGAALIVVAMLIGVLVSRLMVGAGDSRLEVAVDLDMVRDASGGAEPNPAELSDENLSNLLLGGQASEVMVVRALREAQSRQLPTMPQILQRGMASISYAVRLEALRIAGQMVPPGMVPSIVERLEDPDTTVREQAVRTLGRIGDADAVPALRERARVEQSPDVQAALSAVLDQFGS